jgi:hypothetical protein
MANKNGWDYHKPHRNNIELLRSGGYRSAKIIIRAE